MRRERGRAAAPSRSLRDAGNDPGPGWQALARLPIEAALAQLDDLVLNQQESFRLRSLEDLRVLLRRTLKTVPS